MSQSLRAALQINKETGALSGESYLVSRTLKASPCSSELLLARLWKFAVSDIASDCHVKKILKDDFCSYRIVRNILLWHERMCLIFFKVSSDVCIIEILCTGLRHAWTIVTRLDDAKPTHESGLDAIDGGVESHWGVILRCKGTLASMSSDSVD